VLRGIPVDGGAGKRSYAAVAAGGRLSPLRNHKPVEKSITVSGYTHWSCPVLIFMGWKKTDFLYLIPSAGKYV